MSDTAPAAPTFGSRLRGTVGRVSQWWKGQPADAEGELERLRAAAPAPVLWLVGKTQSGKTSIVRALTGADDAEIGSGFRACTKHTTRYPFPGPEAPVLTFLDTRGLDEPGYDPADDLAAIGPMAHAVLIVCRLADFATGSLIVKLKAIRASEANRPFVLVLTCLHEAYPQQQHPPYPAPGERFPEAVETLKAAQEEAFAGLFDRTVLVDLTKPVEGYDVPDYGLEALKTALLELLPDAYRQTLKHLAEADGDFRDRQWQRAKPVIVGYSTLAGTAGALPVPFLDLLILPAIQTKMIRDLAARSGRRDAASNFLELSASAGIGLLATVALRQVAKLIPYVGSVVGAGLASASTYALGRAFLEYDRRVHEGHLPGADEVKGVYEAQFAEAKKRWGK